VSIGPIELLVVKFPGNQFKGEIVPALRELVESGLVRIVDIMFVTKGADDALTALEMNDLDDDDYLAFDPVVEDITGLLTEDDVAELTRTLPANSSAALLLVEHTWATRLRDAVVNAKGELIFSERIPKAVIDELLSARQDASA
jgi:hypothetical protein